MGPYNCTTAPCGTSAVHLVAFSPVHKVYSAASPIGALQYAGHTYPLYNAECTGCIAFCTLQEHSLHTVGKGLDFA